MGGASHLATWPLRQWRRAQLALDLLRQHEYEEAHRMTWDEANAWLRAMPHVGERTLKRSAAEWRKAVEAKAAQYPNG